MSTTAPLSGFPPLDVSHTDDPAAVAAAAVDDYALHVVPRTWRLGKTGMMFAWSSLLAAMFWVVVAATAAVVVGTEQTIIGLAVAALVHSLINYLMQKHASETGLTVALMSRSLFGYHGASIAALVLGLTGIIFAVFEGSVVAFAFQTLCGGPIWIWYLVVVAYLIPLSLGGVRLWLERVNKWLLPIFAVGIITAVVWATIKYGYHGAWFTRGPVSPIPLAGPGWLYVVVVYMGVFSQMMYTYDFARMGKPNDVKFNGWVTFGPVFYLLAFVVNGAIGIYLANTIPVTGGLSETSVVVGIVKMMSVLGLIFIVATQTKINSANIYIASSNLRSFFSRAAQLTLPRWVWVLVVGATMFGVMLTDIFSFILQWLAYQGVVIVAWVAIASLHIVYEAQQGSPEKTLEFRPGRVPGFNPGGILAWTVSSIVGIVLLVSKTAFATEWALIVTFFLAGIIYAFSLLFAKTSWFVWRRPGDPRNDVADAWSTHILCHVCRKSYIAEEMDRDPAVEHQAICASCATGHQFRQAALLESTAYMSTADTRSRAIVTEPLRLPRIE